MEPHFKFPHTILSQIGEANIAETVALINGAYAYQDEAKGQPRITAQKLRQRAEDSQFYIAQRSGRIVGCVYIEQHNHALHFGLLTVSREQRGTGLGAALIQAVEAYAQAQGCRLLELDYMSLAPWLKRYYERYGFTSTGAVTPWGTIDLIRMQKLLGR